MSALILTQKAAAFHAGCRRLPKRARVAGDGEKHTLKLGLAQRRGVGGDEHELRLTHAESLQGRLVTEGDCARGVSFGREMRPRSEHTLARLHDEGQARGQGVGGLLALGGHCVVVVSVGRRSWVG